ncbi:MAG: hypothetical protein IJV44_09620 [Prevotella sp.]|nr:hypothetical protein [Prevotella sp.]
MKRSIISLCLLTTFSVVKAQQPHNVVGYTPSSNTITTLHYGYGNSLESITIAGKTQTTIKVSGNGQPKSISNEFATIEYSFAGTSNVNVTQTVNGETKTSKVPMNSDRVLQFRKDFTSTKNALAGVVDKADKFLENGGASLIGNIISTINDGLDNPINVCFQQALDAAKNTKDPIIPIDCLEALVKATKSHESAGDEIKGKAVDYIFENYKEWRDGWSDLVYKGLMEIDKLQQAKNKQKQNERPEQAKRLQDNDTANEDGNDETSPILDTPKDVTDYVTGQFPDRGGRLPDAIWVNYYKYFLGTPFSYMMKLNKDKKTYRYEDVSEATKLDYDRELDDPYCYMVIWYWDSKEKGIERTIPLKKGHVPDKLPK